MNGLVWSVLQRPAYEDNMLPASMDYGLAAVTMPLVTRDDLAGSMHGPDGLVLIVKMWLDKFIKLLSGHCVVTIARIS